MTLMRGKAQKRDKSNVRNVVFDPELLKFLDDVIVPHVGENRSAVLNAIVREVLDHYKREGSLPIAPVERRIRFSKSLFASTAR